MSKKTICVAYCGEAVDSGEVIKMDDDSIDEIWCDDRYTHKGVPDTIPTKEEIERLEKKLIEKGFFQDK